MELYMLQEDIIKEFHQNGVVVIKNVLDIQDVTILREELELAFTEDISSPEKTFDSGMVHNCMMRGVQMKNLLDNEILHKYLELLFSPTCILYAYQSSTLPPHSKNYGSRIHVDSPRLIPNYDTNIGIIFPLDDFTLDNGATWYLEGSFNEEQLPSSNLFYDNAKRCCCNAGDMIVFKGRLIHAAGENKTNKFRHALTLNFCRSYMRQRFDFPRLCDKSLINSLSEKGQRLLGMNVRMPTSLKEFYLPEASRLYKSNQG